MALRLTGSVANPGGASPCRLTRNGWAIGQFGTFGPVHAGRTALVPASGRVHAGPNNPRLEADIVKIVIGLDGSTHSLVGRDLVAGLRWPAETTVHLVGAYQVPIDWSGGFGSGMPWVGEIEDSMRDDMSEALRAAAEPLVEAGLTVTHAASWGRAADVLVASARETDADLVVVGSRGLGGLKRMLLGSVAGEVAADAPCSVLVARSPTVERIVVATDGSDAANGIADELAAWGTFAGMPTDAVAVSVPDAPAYELMVSLYTLGDDRLDTARQAAEAKAEADAEAMADRLRSLGIPAAPKPLRGDAAAEIVRHAEETGADLVVVGSRGLTGLDRLLLGSVARNVASDAHGSVLIVRKES